MKELSIGDYAKVRSHGERFWVIIEGKSDVGYVGKVNNHLVNAPYQFGQSIGIEEKDIIQTISAEDVKRAKGEK